MDEDILHSVPLPAWALLDILLKRRDPDSYDSPRHPIALIHRRRSFAIYGLILVSLVHLIFRYSYVTDYPQLPVSASVAATSSGSQRGSTPYSDSDGVLAYNASTIPQAQIQRARLGILRAITATRTSSYSYSQDANATLSAIIVHSPYFSIQNTQFVVEVASKYPYIREIIVWNNDLANQLDANTFSLSSDPNIPSPKLRIYNAPSSFSPHVSPVHRVMPPSHAKHLACALATQPACLFLSPSSLPIHLDAIYALYLSTAPTFSQIVAVAPPEEFYALQHLRFQNNDVDLHTSAFYPSRCYEVAEHIVSKDKSKRFWRQILQQNPIIPGDQADIVWSLWMNTHAELLVAPSLPMAENLREPPSTEYKAAQQSLILSSLQTLYTILSSQDPYLSPEPFPISPSPPRSFYRTATHDDRALFISNLDAFSKSPADLTFNAKGEDALPTVEKQKGWFNKQPKKVSVQSSSKSSPLTAAKKAFNPFLSIESIGEYEALWHEQSTDTSALPTSFEEFKASGNPYLAVNGRHPSHTLLRGDADLNGTCWTTPIAPLKDDYFGLWFLGDEGRSIKKMSVFGFQNFKNIVGRGEEDLTAESWEIWTLMESQEGEDTWVLRSLDDAPSSIQIGTSPIYKITYLFSPYQPAAAARKAEGGVPADVVGVQRVKLEHTDEEEGGAENAEPDQVLKKRALPVEPENEAGDAQVEKRQTHEEQAQRGYEYKVRAVRLKSRDRKGTRIKVCGFEIDGWII